MAANLAVVPWKGAENFYQAIQSLWMTHMLVMYDEKYPGAGVSFGRIDQFLYPYYEKSVKDGMDRDFMKEILGCFWFHCNTVYDSNIRTGSNQGITAGFGQLFNLSGLGKDGKDMTNDLTYLFLDVINDMAPILEPKPNVRLHKNTPDELLDKVVDMVAESQGAPFLLNFDERSMAGMMREAKMAHAEKYINEENVHDYVSVGCLENTMAGNDRSGTVDVNVNLLKSMELVYGNGKDFMPFYDPMTDKWSEMIQESEPTGDLKELDTFEKFYGASHTITFNSSVVKDPAHKAKFKAFLRGYIENGGTALQINILDPDVLRDAQEHPTEYRHLLVRVTGYNAYFTSIGRELQNEIIARESHKGF